jgi:hypothetical protein
METREAEGLWAGFKRYMRRLRDEMERDSVFRAGPSHSSCCHMSGQVLERRSAACHEPLKRETEKDRTPRGGSGTAGRID